MALGDHFPVSESFGVFVGVAGFDWLADGHAELQVREIHPLAVAAPTEP